ncbi:hypothetical protein WMY93_021727 [Mugilogobius chulae]|uniref:Uncharacterized protein n=1 Tax=Mugilogobius chulae TaxID=88201 RepID=A0AAW0NM00_9GOBI
MRKLCEYMSNRAVLENDMSSKPAEVQCDMCSEPKLKALKSCLVCLSSFCETHLQPHLIVSGLKIHQLMEPVENLKDRMCPEHQQLLELFCDTDEKMVCTVCVPLEHKNHELLSLEEACERRRSSLLHTQTQTQHMVEQRLLKVEEINRCVELKAAGALLRGAAGEEESFKPAQELLQQLEQEICELERINTEAEQLLNSQDPLYFLKHCTALTAPAGLKDWSSVNFEPETSEGSAAQALQKLEEQLSEEFKQLLKQLSNKTELRRVQKFAVDITLDPDTASPYLVLSEDLKQVHHTDVKKQLPDSPLRIDKCPNVLTKQSFSSGKFYFEVEVKGKTDWDLGVAQESINRKINIVYSPRYGFWGIWLRNKNLYQACDKPRVTLSPKQAIQKVGVFVDCDEGLVSFYDADSAEPLYSFTGCSFKEKLFPYFSPCVNDGGLNSAPLVIAAVETFSDKK